MAVVVDQGHAFKPFSRPPRCKLQSFTQLDYEVLNFNQSNVARSLEHAFNIHKSFSTPCLSLSSQVKDDCDTNSRIEIIVGHALPRVRALVAEVAMAMASGVDPVPVSKGLGGAYFLHAGNGDTIAVAKPIDEEPLAFNNPKGLVGRKLGQPGMKCSIRIGETGLRESAAYFLDHDGFAGVPPTALVKFSHVKFNFNNSGSDSSAPVYKIASLQRFVNHDSDAGDLGPCKFSVTSVHHIGILDVRLMNLDRHAENILVKDGVGGTAELVPIDHGFCLPESLDDPYFEWLHWPQAAIPFSESEIKYISSLDPYEDARLLRKEVPSIGESSIRVLVLCTIFLKQATAYGLCLADIGEMMTRELCGGKENMSTLEKLCTKAKSIGLSDDYDNNDNENQHEEVDDMFQFDHEHDEDQVSDKGKPSKVCFSLNKNEHYPIDYRALNTFMDNHENGEEDSGDGDNGPKAGNLMKSLSFPIPNYNHVGHNISFGELDDEEWRSFLECFEKLLPEAFEERKSMGLLRRRLGSSCEF